MYYLHCKVVHVIIYETKKQGVDMHFVRTCINIFILTFSFFNQSVSQKNCKSNWGWNLKHTF